MNELEQWILIGFSVYITAMFIIIFIASLRRRGKIAGRIITPLGRMTKWVKPEFEAGKIYATMRKANDKKGIPIWRPEIRQTNDFPKLFGRRGKEFYIKPEANESVVWNFDQEEIDQPLFDRKTECELTSAQAIKQRGKVEKPISNWIFYLNLIGIVVIGILCLMIYMKLVRL